MADEVTDCSNKEQLSLVLRYVNPSDSQIREDVIEFLECDTCVSGSALAGKIMSFIDKHGLKATYLHGESYEGAGNMSCNVTGAAAIISSRYPQALYSHCASHSLIML